MFVVITRVMELMSNRIIVQEQTHIPTIITATSLLHTAMDMVTIALITTGDPILLDGMYRHIMITTTIMVTTVTSAIK